MSDVELEVSPCYRGKPDPDEPWRYVCPNCQKQVHRSNETTRYNCNSCNESFKFEELEDLKEGVIR